MNASETMREAIEVQLSKESKGEGGEGLPEVREASDRAKAGSTPPDVPTNITPSGGP
ncbi:hypothetical protein [Halorubrum aquaticum]|uniref:hypothetical protein n=1 Tax=Halorubrum aquaticum TaxID=387340 RepID=UPI00165FCF84|nr:hypothetical protein [Halorubrum aquaticum]